MRRSPATRGASCCGPSLTSLTPISSTAWGRRAGRAFTASPRSCTTRYSTRRAATRRSRKTAGRWTARLTFSPTTLPRRSATSAISAMRSPARAACLPPRRGWSCSFPASPSCRRAACTSRPIRSTAIPSTLRSRSSRAARLIFPSPSPATQRPASRWTALPSTTPTRSA